MDTQLITTTVSAITLVTEIFNVAKEFSTPYRKWKIRAKIKDELYEQEYRKSINANISKVAENNLQVPNPSIVFPAMSTSFLYIHEETLRELFAKLIASSFDKDKTKHLHPGFIEIIKQLSPVDCRVLMYLHDNQSKFEVITAIKEKSDYPILNCELTKEFGIEQIALSLTNLKRLGILDINSYQFTKNLVFYETTTDYDDDEDDTKSLKVNPEIEKTLITNEYKIVKCSAYLTQLGNSFLKVCID